MLERHGVTGVLVRHFFRRFFDNDTLQTEGDTLTTVVRAVVAVAVPGLTYAFFLQTEYAPPGRAPWSAVQDQYFFVLFSFVVMGAAAIFEWETLFPDRLDFLILSALPLKPAQMLAGKAAALVAFLAMFLVGCNLCGAVLLSAIGGHLLRQLLAHLIAVLMAGVFASLLMLAISGLLLCILPTAWFRVISPLLRMVSIAALVLLLLHFVKYGDTLQAVLSHPSGGARWVAPLWFLGLYQRVFHGQAAPAFALIMARYALLGTSAVFAIVLVTYPIAWARMRRLAFEGAGQSRRQSTALPASWRTTLVNRLVQRPGERAVFHFISQTIARNHRYQLYLAMYSGMGLAVAIACAVNLREQTDRLQLGLWQQGLHAAMPLLLFWLIAGLRNAFAFPLNLAAGWLFRMTAVNLQDCASAARRWVRLCSLTMVIVILLVLRLAHWDMRQLLVQCIVGISLTILLTDAFLFQRRVPFNQPRLPGKTNFPLLLTLYIGALPLFVLGVIRMESQMERSLMKLAFFATATLLIHAGLSRIYSLPAEHGEEEGYEGEFLVLGINALQ